MAWSFICKYRQTTGLSVNGLCTTLLTQCLDNCLGTRSGWSALRALISLCGLSDHRAVSDPGYPHRAWSRPVVYSPNLTFLITMNLPADLGSWLNMAMVSGSALLGFLHRSGSWLAGSLPCQLCHPPAQLLTPSLSSSPHSSASDGPCCCPSVTQITFKKT